MFVLKIDLYIYIFFFAFLQLHNNRYKVNTIVNEYMRKIL